MWPGKAYPLGATYDGAGTNFALFSEVAERVELCLFDADGTETRITLPEVDYFVWHGYIPSIDIQGGVISAVIVPATKGIALSFELKNLTANTAHILVVGNFNMSANSGADFVKTRTNGINICQYGSDDKISIDHCMKSEADNMNMYNDVGACEALRGTIYFGQAVNSVAVKSGDTLNYALKMIVRFTPPSSDPLLADKPASAARIATLNLPPITVH